MTRIARSEGDISPLGEIGPTAPSARFWAAGIAAAFAVHAIAAAPYLRAPAPIAADADLEPLGEEIGVSLAPMVRPPEPPPEEAPEPEPEIPVIEERASNSPPPAPPAKPRELPDLPDIRPQAVPDLWSGAPGGGSIELAEYLLLREWLSEARLAVLQKLSYPEQAREQGLSGSALVDIVASREGKIVSWRFRQRTGSLILDNEISRTIDSIRRLPKFPKGTRYEQLTFTLPIRFELVFQDRRGREIPPESSGSAPAQQRAPQSSGLPIASLQRCAADASRLAAERDAIETLRAGIEAAGAEYEKQANRYHRNNEEPPRRVTRMLDEYNENLATYNQNVSAFQESAAAYSGRCGRGSATWENYQVACAPYRATGNIYCEAFGDLWLRLQSEG